MRNLIKDVWNVVVNLFTKVVAKYARIVEVQNVVNSPFKELIPHYYLGKLCYGTPYMYPWYFNSTILTIRKQHPIYSRCRYFKLFGYEISYGWPIMFCHNNLGWKDKFDTPRFEWSPAFYIFFFKWQFCIHWRAFNGNDDQFWEQYLWRENYCHKSTAKAVSTWPWKDMKGVSSWDDKYLKT